MNENHHIERLKAKNLKKQMQMQKKAQKSLKKLPFLHRNMTTPEKIVGTILIIGLMITFYCVSPYSRISKIIVAGTNAVDAEWIVKSSAVAENQMILPLQVIQQYKIEQLKKNNPRIEQVTFTIDEKRQLTIAVKEYETIAYVQLGDNYYAVLSNGVVLQSDSKKLLTTLPTVKWQDDIQSLEMMAVELAKVSQEIRQNISEIVFNANSPIVMDLYMNDGNIIKVNYTNFANKLVYYASMKTILGSKKGVIDLSVGAYFTPFE